VSYTAFVFLPERVSVSLNQVADLVRQFFESSEHPENQFVRVTVGNDVVVVSRDNWSLFIGYPVKPFAFEGNEIITQQLRQRHPNIINTTSHTCQIEVSTNKDPDMDYFNDYILVLEQLTQLPDAIVYDYGSGEIL
jgi:hypothetical protein